MKNSTESAINLAAFSTTGFNRGASAIKEALWWIVRGTFFLTWFPFPSSVRVFFLRLFGAKIGQGVVIRSRVNISFPWRVTIGDHVWLGEDVMILSLAPVTIASNVCISQRAFLCTGSHDFRRANFALITKPIIIQDSVWIAAQAFVGPGVTIAQRSMITAGSVVTQNVPDGAMVRGNPATVVKLI